MKKRMTAVIAGDGTLRCVKEEIPELKGRLLKLAEVLENSLEIEEILKENPYKDI